MEMGEIKTEARKRKEVLKKMILKLHEGEAPGGVREELSKLLGRIPHGEVVEVEEELIREGLPQEEILKLCDLHARAVRDVIDTKDAKPPESGHPVDTFLRENRALEAEMETLKDLFRQIKEFSGEEEVGELMENVRFHLHALMDLDKHYRRKENLLFPHLEAHGIQGPPVVMWGKHDEVRKLMKHSVAACKEIDNLTASDAAALIDDIFQPALNAIEEMIYKEEKILFPMCMDTLREEEWWEIYTQSPEIGFCLVDPDGEWRPGGIEPGLPVSTEGLGTLRLPSGSFTLPELTALLNTLPVDLTFVDKEDTVRFFTQGRERIFDRNRAILGRKVQFCHPPKSVHVVEKILNDFKSGTQDRAAFWITLNGRFIMIEYFALRDGDGEYLGTLEVTQDLTEKRSLQGERRLLSYDS